MRALLQRVSEASVEVGGERIAEIGAGLTAGLEPARTLPGVADVRVCGAIGVIECDRPVDLTIATPAALDRGVWLRLTCQLDRLQPVARLRTDLEARAQEHVAQVQANDGLVFTPDEIAQVASAMVEVARLTGSRRI